jgi:hypothetical protein
LSSLRKCGRFVELVPRELPSEPKLGEQRELKGNEP